MNYIIGIVIFVFGTLLSMYLDIKEDIDCPPIYWLIGGLTSILTLIAFQN